MGRDRARPVASSRPREPRTIGRRELALLATGHELLERQLQYLGYISGGNLVPDQFLCTAEVILRLGVDGGLKGIRPGRQRRHARAGLDPFRNELRRSRPSISNDLRVLRPRWRG